MNWRRTRFREPSFCAFRSKVVAQITGAHHTSFTVADLDRSVRFFRDVLGLELVYQREIRDAYFGRIVGLPNCVVRAALLRLPGGNHHVELFEYREPAGVPV